MGFSRDPGCFLWNLGIPYSACIIRSSARSVPTRPVELMVNWWLIVVHRDSYGGLWNNLACNWVLTNQLMANCWFGARWFGIRIGVPLRIPIPFTFGNPRNPNHRDPKHQLTSSWRREHQASKGCLKRSLKGVHWAIMGGCSIQNKYIYNTLHETNKSPLKMDIAPENGWLENYFPLAMAYFQGPC